MKISYALRPSLLVALLGTVFGLGCASARKPPPLTPVDFAGGRAAFRGYGAAGFAGICDAEPRFLIDELSGVNGLLDRYLDRAPGSASAAWTPEEVALVESAPAALAPVVAAHQKNLDLVARCSFAGEGSLPWVITRGRELLTQVEARQNDARAALVEVRARRELEAWNEERRRAQRLAQERCPPRPGRYPMVYYASRDEQGVTQWLFCDGSKIRLEAGRQTFEPGLDRPQRGRRTREQKHYEAAAKDFPAVAIDTAPGQSGAPRQAAAPDAKK